MYEEPAQFYDLNKLVHDTCKNRFEKRILGKQENGTFKENWNPAFVQKQVNKTVEILQDKIWTQGKINLSCELIYPMVLSVFKKLTVEHEDNLKLKDWIEAQFKND